MKHVESGRVVSRAKLEIREKHGLKADSLDGPLAGRVHASRCLRIESRRLLGESPRWTSALFKRMTNAS